MDSKHRLTIGFLADNLFDGYEGPIWSSAVNTAKKKGINFFSFADCSIDCWSGNSTNHLIRNQHIDGYISISGTLATKSTQSEIEKFYQQYISKPIVSIGPIAKGYSNILVDNSGISQMIDHLIEYHNYRKIAFISGPLQNFDAEERLKTYQASIEKHNIQYDPNLVHIGELFWYDDGIEAVRVFLDERKVSFEAIVAANDYMAIGAIKELQSKGYRVPEDIAVVGFDDILEARNLNIPLTTVRQPFKQIGEVSIEKIISLIDGAPAEETILNTNIVIRKSCGCDNISNHYHRIFSCPSLYNDDLPGKTDNSLIQKIALELETKFPDVKSKIKENWSTELVESFVSDIKTQSCTFLNILCSYIEDGYKKGLSIMVWFSILRELATMVQHFNNNLVTPLIAEAFTAMGEMLEKVNVKHELQAEEFFNTTQRLYHIFNKSQNHHTDQNEQRISMDLDRLGIQSFYLSRFDENDIQKAKLSYHFSKNQHVCLQNIDQYFESKRLIPGCFQKNGERYSFVILPIAQTGFAIFEVDLHDESYYNHQNITSYNAIKMIVLINEIRHYTNKLEYLVDERTKLLKEAEDIQQCLIETAHKAGMTEIAIGIMHNIGNLLNSINVSTEEIENILNKSKLAGLLKANDLFKIHQQELINVLDSKSKIKLLPEYYEQIGNSLKNEQEKISDEISQLINKITLIHGIIQTLQEYASIDQYNVFEEEVEIGSIIENSLKIQESNIHKHNIKVIKDLNTPVIFVTNRTKLTHILVNLIKNAVEAMLNISNVEPTIRIKLYLNALSIPVIEVTDNGDGIATEDLKKMFTYGFTTKENGHGFGLHTCANYITEMGGSITVHSDGKGKGATFMLTLKKIDHN